MVAHHTISFYIYYINGIYQTYLDLMAKNQIKIFLGKINKKLKKARFALNKKALKGMPKACFFEGTSL